MEGMKKPKKAVQYCKGTGTVNRGHESASECHELQVADVLVLIEVVRVPQRQREWQERLWECQLRMLACCTISRECVVVCRSLGKSHEITASFEVEWRRRVPWIILAAGVLNPAAPNFSTVRGVPLEVGSLLPLLFWWPCMFLMLPVYLLLLAFLLFLTFLLLLGSLLLLAFCVVIAVGCFRCCRPYCLLLFSGVPSLLLLVLRCCLWA